MPMSRRERTKTLSVVGLGRGKNASSYPIARTKNRFCDKVGMGSGLVLPRAIWSWCVGSCATAAAVGPWASAATSFNDGSMGLLTGCRSVPCCSKPPFSVMLRAWEARASNTLTMSSRPASLSGYADIHLFHDASRTRKSNPSTCICANVVNYVDCTCIQWR
jgi:hypothetical protein